MWISKPYTLLSIIRSHQVPLWVLRYLSIELSVWFGLLAIRNLAVVISIGRPIRTRHDSALGSLLRLLLRHVDHLSIGLHWLVQLWLQIEVCFLFTGDLDWGAKCRRSYLFLVDGRGCHSWRCVPRCWTVSSTRTTLWCYASRCLRLWPCHFGDHLCGSMFRLLGARWRPLLIAADWFYAARRPHTWGPLALVFRFLYQHFRRFRLHNFLYFFDDWVASGFSRLARSLSRKLGCTSSWQACRTERALAARASCRVFTPTFAHLLTFSKMIFPCFILSHIMNTFLKSTHKFLEIKCFATIARLNWRQVRMKLFFKLF